MPNDFKVGEDWTDSVKDFATTGTLASGAQAVTGTINASGEITGATIVQGVEDVLDDSDLGSNGGDVAEVSDLVNAGPGVPTSPIAGTLWFDTGNNLLCIRNEANTAWLDIWDLADNKPVITNLTTELTAAMIVDDTITGAKLAPAIAGDGLVQDVNGNLDVNPDGTTIEVDTDALQIVSDNAEVTNVRVSAVDTTPGILDGKLVAGNNISLVASGAGDETLTIETKFRGALVFLDTSQTFADGAANSPIVWTDEIYDTDAFSDISAAGPAPERFTIPANVSKVKLTAHIEIDPSAGIDVYYFLAQLKKNGNAFAGSCSWQQEDVTTLTAAISSGNIVTAVLSVVETDYFEIDVSWTDTTGAVSMDVRGTAGGFNSWFAIEVLE